MSIMLQQELDKTNQALYFQRQPGDVDMIAVVRALLIRIGLKDKVEQLFDTNPTIQAALNHRPMEQRQAIIEYWNLQFMNTPSYGHEERACLNLPFSDEEWLRVFQEKLIPFIVDNQLPKPLYGMHLN